MPVTISHKLFIGLLAVGLALGACATRPTEPEAQTEFDKVNDPGEPTNRAVFGFNQGFDRNLFKPVAQAYQDTVPGAVRRSVHNFLTNLDEPWVGFNDLLQGNTTRALTASTRFFINTTFGAAGFFDMAADWGLPHHDADFGQTLGVWGIAEGPYITLPIFGPSNVRDTVGLVVSFAANPLTWMSGPAVTVANLGRSGTQGVDERSRNIDTLDDLERNSLDFYATLRSVYRQHRTGMIEDARSGNPNARVEFGYPKADEPVKK
ncbi:MAG: VacJ family lipoprotein [Proteobacteria bacterium]|nr:VacJ family lipoprotein [Pseudomonadota bacterium]